MREISIASQMNLEKSYVKAIFKVLKGVAHRRCARDMRKSHLHAWRIRTENSRARATMQRAFRLLLKITTRKLLVLFENWAWEAGRMRRLDRLCHLHATGTATKTEQQISRSLLRTSAGRAVPRLRRLGLYLAVWKNEAWTRQDAWSRRILQRFLKHRVVAQWNRKTVEASCIRRKITCRLVSRLHTAGQDAMRRFLEKWARLREEKMARLLMVCRAKRKTCAKLSNLAFDELLKTASDSRMSRKFVIHVVRVLMKTIVSRCVEDWRDRVYLQQTQRVSLEIAGKIRQRCLSSTMRVCLDAWVDACLVAREMVAKNLRASIIVRRHLMHGIRNCWSTWVQFRAGKHRVKRKVGKILMNLVLRCFSAWLDFVEIHRHDMQKRLKAEKVTRRILFHNMVVCYWIWTRAVQESKAFAHLEKQSEKTLRRKCGEWTAHCFYCWHDFYLCQRGTRMRFQDFWVRWNHQLVKKAFEFLVEEVRASRSLHRVMLKIFGRRYSSITGSAFARIKAVCLARRDLVWRSKKLVAWQYQHLFRSLASPQNGGIDISSLSFDIDAMQWSIANTRCLLFVFGHLRTLMRHNRRISSLAARLLSTTIAAAMRAFQEQVRLLKHQKRMRAVLLHRRASSVLSTVVLVWRDGVYNCHRRARRFHDVLESFALKRQSKVVRAWLHFLLLQQNLRDTCRLLAGVTRRVFLRQCFGSWRETACNRRNRRECVMDVSERAGRRMLQKYLEAMTCVARNKMWVLSVLKTCHVYRCARELRPVLREWARSSTGSRLRAAGRARLQARVCRWVLAHSFNTWRLVPGSKKHLLGILNTCSVYLRACLQRSCLREWGRRSCGSRWRAVAGQRLKMQMVCRGLRSTLHHWCDYCGVHTGVCACFLPDAASVPCTLLFMCCLQTYMVTVRVCTCA